MLRDEMDYDETIDPTIVATKETGEDYLKTQFSVVIGNKFIQDAYTASDTLYDKYGA